MFVLLFCLGFAMQPVHKSSMFVGPQTIQMYQKKFLKRDSVSYTCSNYLTEQYMVWMAHANKWNIYLKF